MSDINVDDFCKDAARALTALYGSFPRPHALFVEDIAGPDQVDEFGMHSNRHMACFGALLWLAEEGFLRFVDTIRQEALDQAVLTGRAFTLLSTPVPGFLPPGAADLPPSLRSEQQSHVHRLRHALEQRSSNQVREAMMTLMNAMLNVPGFSPPARDSRTPPP